MYKSGLLCHILFEKACFSTPFGFADVYLGFCCLNWLELFADGIKVRIRLIYGKVYPLNARPPRLLKRVLGLSLYVTRVWLLLNYIGAGTHYIGRRNQGLKAGEPRVLPSVPEWVFFGQRDFRFQRGIVLGSGSAPHWFGVAGESRLQAYLGGLTSWFPQPLCLQGVQILVLSIIVVVFGFGFLVLPDLGADQVGGCPVVIELVGHVVVGSYRFLPLYTKYLNANFNYEPRR